MRFEFATATRIIFGNGTVKETGSIAGKMGHRAFVITGRSVERSQPLIGQLNDTGIEVTQFSIPEEPTTQLALAAVVKARKASSMKGNPIELTQEELREILAKAI